MATVSWDINRTKTLTIASSAQESDVLYMGSLGRRTAYRMGILAPMTLTGVVTIEVCNVENGTYRTLQSDNVDIAVSAGKASVLDPVPFPYVRFTSSLAEGADRDILVMAIGPGA